MQNVLWLLVVFLFLLSPHSLAQSDQRFHFMTAKGTQIVNEDGDPIFFRGISFGNRVWVNDRIPELHHSEVDFKRVRKLGMNLVRFYMNYQTFENDQQPYVYLEDGWQWLDQNIAWARKHGVYLILNMHVPQGGFQSQGEGTALWKSVEMQNRLSALWQAIAKRYKDEPVVFGFDLLNEPGVPRHKNQWQELAQRLVVDIRKIDTRHPIIVERVNSINRKWLNDKEMNFVKVKGDNIIYTFHSYDPYEFTHQGAPWDKWVRNQDKTWPDAKNNYSKAYLEKTIDNFLAWGERNNVPLYFGEWGVYKQGFEGGRGGLIYVQDMIDIIESRKITNTYHVYHEESFGLYRGDGKIDPKNVNEPLETLFIRNYTGQK